MIFKLPPQFGQRSMSTSKTRLSGRAQLMRAGAPCAWRPSPEVSEGKCLDLESTTLEASESFLNRHKALNRSGLVERLEPAFGFGRLVVRPHM